MRVAPLTTVRALLLIVPFASLLLARTWNSKLGRRQAILALVLLTPAILLTVHYTEVPGFPGGNNLSLFIFQPEPASSAPTIFIGANPHRLVLNCQGCDPAHPMLIVFENEGEPAEHSMVTDAHELDNGPAAFALGDSFVLGDPALRFTCRPLVVRGSDVLSVGSTAPFMRSVGARTRIGLPTVRIGSDTLVNELERRGYGPWYPAKDVSVNELGDALTPRSQPFDEYRVDFVSQAPGPLGGLPLLNWSDTNKLAVPGPLATIVSLPKEATATRMTILAGTLAGAGAMPLIEALRRAVRRRRRQVQPPPASP